MPHTAVGEDHGTGARCTQPSSDSLMHPLQRSLALLRWRRATPFLFIALILILFCIISTISKTFYPPQSQKYHLGGRWRDAHAALGLPALPDTVPGLAAAADAPQHTAFIPRFDLRKRAALVREARASTAPLFLAQDALRQPVAGLEETRRAFRERDGERGAGRGGEGQGIARHRAVYSPFRGKKGGR